MLDVQADCSENIWACARWAREFRGQGNGGDRVAGGAPQQVIRRHSGDVATRLWSVRTGTTHVALFVPRTQATTPHGALVFVANGTPSDTLPPYISRLAVQRSASEHNLAG